MIQTAVLSDPSGAVFRVWQANVHRGAQLVNAPGTWNFSELNTRDPQRAKACYAAVFGWVADAVDLGEFVATMWRVPVTATSPQYSTPTCAAARGARGARGLLRRGRLDERDVE